MFSSLLLDWEKGNRTMVVMRLPAKVTPPVLHPECVTMFLYALAVATAFISPSMEHQYTRAMYDAVRGGDFPPDDIAFYQRHLVLRCGYHWSQWVGNEVRPLVFAPSNNPVDILNTVGFIFRLRRDWKNGDYAECEEGRNILHGDRHVDVLDSLLSHTNLATMPVIDGRGNITSMGDLLHLP